MGRGQVSTEGAGNKGSSELNSHPKVDGKREGRDAVVVGVGQRVSEEDESRVIGVPKDLNNGHAPALRSVQTAAQQQQPLGPVVRWERFLPLPSLKVLLVENDDSTRQVVSALLRNCSYEVTTAANGIKAWKILEDLTNHIDLVLTEVVMPCLSGIGLLTKIMSHKTLKDIPVIMMSSHDSMGIVFTCLSKGAVDFLVKPIRKNELKNLWQHVWRRCHSSSGSGSESGIQTQKSVKSKSDDESDNHTGSNDEDDNASTGLNVRDGSDNGSGTQSSWTKRAIEVESPQQMSTWDQLADPHDSTCVQFIHPKPETFSNEWVPMTAIRAFEETKEQLTENVDMGKDLEIGIPTNPDLQPESCLKEKVSTNMSVTKDKMPQQDPKKDMQSNNELLELKSSSPSSKLRAQAASPIGANINSSSIAQMDTKGTRASNCLSKIPEIKDKAASELPSFELSLKRLRSAGEDGSSNQDERTILRRSDLSAFTRYNTTNAATQATGYAASSSCAFDNSSDAMKTESQCNVQSNSNTVSNSNTAALNQRSNGSSNNNDMGSTTENAFTKPAALKDESVSVSSAKSIHLSAFQIVQQGRNYPPHQVISEKVDNVVAAGVGQPPGPQQQIQVQHHYHHYHQHHHHIHSLQLQPTPGPEDLSLKNMAAAAPQCGSSNVLGGAMEVNTENYSLNGSVSGSNHGSNGQNGSSIAVNTRAVNMESDNGVAGKSGATGGGDSRSGTGLDPNRVAQREAALNKFRQKRKQRCFEKKVHYQSRKRLAEQRPRVRGQFVRQNFYEHANWDTDC